MKNYKPINSFLYRQKEIAKEQTFRNEMKKKLFSISTRNERKTFCVMFPLKNLKNEKTIIK